MAFSKCSTNGKSPLTGTFQLQAYETLIISVYGLAKTQVSRYSRFKRQDILLSRGRSIMFGIFSPVFPSLPVTTHGCTYDTVLYPPLLRMISISYSVHTGNQAMYLIQTM